jgi:hypothetical protein
MRAVDPTREYVAGGVVSWYASYRERLTALPLPIDDLTAELGDDIYERMLRDPQAGACIDVLRTGILEDGLSIRPAVDSADADGYDQAIELLGLVEQQLDDLETPLDDVLWDMLSALALGNRVAEEVYAYDTSYTGRTELVLRRLNVKPRANIAFVTDTFGNVVGLIGNEPGQQLLRGQLLNDEQRAHIIPRSKFAILSVRPTNNDPRGTSLLRPAYNAWWLKMQAWPEYLKYLSQFASPSLVGTTAPNAADEPVYDTAGNPTGEYQTPEEALLTRLLQFRNGTALALPSGATLDSLGSSGDGTPFLHAFELFDKQITKAILYQTLATEEATYGTRAQGDVHASILATLVRQTKRGIARMFRRDVLQQIVIANRGDGMRQLTPYATLANAETQDVTGMWTALAALARTDYLDPSQFPAIDELLNLPPRMATDAEVQPVPVEDVPDEDEDAQ